MSGPDIAGVAALIGDHARAQTLTALMAGRALTATELANIAGVTKQTISAHLSKLRAARLIAVESQGRHRYFRLANAEVAHLLETLMGLAFRSSSTELSRSGPHDPAMRKARLCYDHLAGELGVFVYDRLVQQGALSFGEGELQLSEHGQSFFAKLNISVAELTQSRRVLCRACLDWSERRHHLAGSLGAALLNRIVTLRWAKLDGSSRVVTFSPSGERSLREFFKT